MVDKWCSLSWGPYNFSSPRLLPKKKKKKDKRVCCWPTFFWWVVVGLLIVWSMYFWYFLWYLLFITSHLVLDYSLLWELNWLHLKLFVWFWLFLFNNLVIYFEKKLGVQKKITRWYYLFFEKLLDDPRWSSKLR